MVLRRVVVLCSLVALTVLAGAAPNPFLATLVNSGGVTVVYGSGAQSPAAAQVICNEIRKIQPDWKNLLSDKDFDSADMSVTGKTNIIVVGTLANNVVLQGRGWLPTWWLDRDWYYNSYKPDGKQSFALSPELLKMPYMPTTGFIFAGYGEWPHAEGRLGYVEVDRSPYYMEWLVRTRMANSKCFPGQIGEMTKVTTPGYATDTPLFLIVRVVGTGDAGEVAAAHAFVQNGMLNGLVLNGAAASPGPAMFTLPQSRYYSKLPFTPPDHIAGYTYQGWLLADADLYDGFVTDSSTAVAASHPLVMYRVKYKPAWGIKNFWSSPHRRAGAFEVCAVQFATAQEATDAMTNLQAALKARSYASRVTGCRMVVVGSVLYLESFPEPAGSAMIDAYKQLGKW